MNPNDTQNLVEVRFVSTYPFSIVMGGFEFYCKELCHSLQKLGISAKLLNWHDPDDRYNTLHLCGPSPNWYDMCINSKGKYSIVVCALAGTKGKNQLYKVTGRITSWASSVLHQETTFTRVNKVLSLADRVICTTNPDLSFFIDTFDLPEEKVVMIPGGVAESRFVATGELFEEKFGFKDYILFVGNIVARKNPLRLAEIIMKNDWKGVFISGIIPAEQEYAHRFANLVQDSPNIIWIKSIAYDDPIFDSAYAGARVFCLPSVLETQPLSALEAMAAHAPMILSNYPYAYEPPFENTVHCNPNDSADIERCIKMVMADPEKYRQPLPERYMWKNIALETANIYKQLPFKK